jgi:hypothetical protein
MWHRMGQMIYLELVDRLYRTATLRHAAREAREGSRRLRRDSRRARLAWHGVSSDPIAGGSDVRDDLCASIRERLADGRLARVDGRVYAGRASGRTCDVCEEPIRPPSAEYEVADGAPGRAHHACYVVWLRESQTAGSTPPRRSPPGG